MNDKIFPADELEQVIYKSLHDISDALEERFNKIGDIEDDEERSEAIRFAMSLVSEHFGAFMASTSFSIINDPENWIKHSFYGSLEHLKHYRKDAFERLAKSGQESIMEH